MADAETESRLEEVVTDLASGIGGNFQSFEDARGVWHVSIEKPNGDFAVKADGPTYGKALNNLISAAQANGIG